jgi:hypothetical protein
MEPAQNVVVDITLPSNVSFVDASGETAACDSGVGTVSCQLGDVAGGGATSIALTTDAVAVGAGIFEATVSASADDQPDNNQDTFQLTVDPAADPAVSLVVNAPAAAQVMLNGSATVSTTLENRSSLGATGVTLSVSLGAGLRADSATWSIGACSVAAQQIDCQAGNFDAQSDSTLNIGVTGLTAGTWTYTVALASAEADLDPADNSIQGSVTVESPSGGGGDSGGKQDSGGGGFSWLFLLLLGWRAHYASRR